MKKLSRAEMQNVMGGFINPKVDKCEIDPQLCEDSGPGCHCEYVNDKIKCVCPVIAPAA
ncbi:hypothetical protein ACTHGU_20270 [Chitinophagaceae bacterium MMS25-I14]